MDQVQGKLAHTEKNMQRILELVQNKNFYYGINEYNFIYYIRIEPDQSQLWAMVNAETQTIRNCGLSEPRTA